MTAFMFQEALCRELENIFRHSLFKDSTGQYGQIKVYNQNLPIPESEEEPDLAPYIIVRVDSGKTETEDEPQKVVVMLIIDYFDDTLENNGHQGVLNIIQHIYERFERDHGLDGKYYLLDPIEWALQEEQSFPHFIGAVAMTFAIPAIRREEERV